MKKEKTDYKLTDRTEVEVRFYDIDALNIVWHGNYVKYLENGRESFGKTFGIGYLDIYNYGYTTPIVDMHIRYLETVKLEEELIIETSYIPCRGAKLMFEYVIYRKSDMHIVARASTIQLFMTRDGIFETSAPDFYRHWRKKWDV